MKTLTRSLTKIPLLALAASFVTLAPCFGDEHSTIPFEAESFLSASGDGFDVLSDTDAGTPLGGQYITTASDSAGSVPTNTVSYNVTAPAAGQYYLYMRVAVGPQGGNDDSVLVPNAAGAAPSGWKTLNNIARNSANDVDGYRDLDGMSYFWINTSARDAVPTGTAPIYNLAAGANTFVLGGREDGFRVDALVLSTNPHLNSKQLDQSFTTIIIEAESFVSESGDGFDVLSDTAAGVPLGGEYITTASNSTDLVPTNTVTYNVFAPAAGQYDLYLRVAVGPQLADDDSVLVPTAAGGSPTSWKNLNNIAAPNATDVDGNSYLDPMSYFWINASNPSAVPKGTAPRYSLVAGANTLVLGGREDGFRIDALALSTNGALSSAQLDQSAGFLVERWDDIPHYSVNDLVTSAKFYDQPDSEVYGGSARVIFKNSFFGSRMRGYITPEFTGDYTFWISGRNSVQLWISDDTEQGKYAKRLIAALDSSIGTGHGIIGANLWDQFSSQRAEPVSLEAGQSYYVEILHQNGHSDRPHASLAWARDDGDRELVPLSAITRYTRTLDDLGDDYLPDAWETQYGLDPADNGLIDPVRQGERGDYDGDGLSNREEYLLGTDPTNPDTDGDGLLDSQEINNYGTDPTVSDAPSGQTFASLDLSTFDASESSAWTLTSQGLIPASFRGNIQFNFSVPADGFWLLDVATVLLGDLYLHETVDVEVLIDGVSMGERTLVYGSAREALLRVFTPYLTAGTHTIGLKVNNTVTRRMVGIRSIDVIEPQGADLDNDGIPDWVAAQIAGENGLRPYSLISRTSPVGLEGSARMRSQVTLNATPVTPGLDQSHWYAGLPLDETATTPFTVMFEQGFQESGSIAWQATNVFHEETLGIRKGDSLKLIGQPLAGTSGQAVTLTFGPVNWDGTPGAAGTYEVALANDADHHIHTFAESGNHKVRATLADGSTAVMSLEVKKADFSSAPQDLLANKTGTLTFSTSTVSPSAHFDGGQTVSITNPATLSGSTITLHAAPNQKSGSTRLLARLHDQGPVIARQPLNLINLSDVLQNDSDYSFTSPDFPGFRVLRSPIVATGLPEGATMVVTVFRSGVSFLDGTTTLTLSAGDFENGVYNLEFLFPENLEGGYCHYIDIYDRNGKYLGRR